MLKQYRSLFIWKVKENFITYYGIEEFSFLANLELIKAQKFLVNFTGPKDKQLLVVSAFQEAIKDKYIGGGIISAGGYGKTVLALYLTIN